jgi:tetratricopeptide (TPR) repeat protein
MINGEINKEFGRVYMQTGQWERAEEACSRALSAFLKEGHYRGAAESVRNLANLRFQLGQFDESSLLCDKAVKWATQAGDFQLRATILNTQGAIKSIKGEHTESIKIFGLCLSDFRRSGNKSRQAHILHNIGLANLEIDRYDEAKKALEESLSLALETKDTNLVELCYQNLARLYLKQSDIVAARSLIKTARDLMSMVKSPYIAADLAIIEAMAKRLSGDLKKADKILVDALDKARNNNLLQQEAEILLEAGQIAAERGRINIARSRLEASITLLKKTGGAQLKEAVEKLKNLDTSVNRTVQV